MESEKGIWKCQNEFTLRLTKVSWVALFTTTVIKKIKIQMVLYWVKLTAQTTSQGVSLSRRNIHSNSKQVSK